MFTPRQEKEILDYIREQRTEIDQIAEFMYNNSQNVCGFGSGRSLATCRAIGIHGDSKASIIIGELIYLYKKIYGDDYEVILKKKT